MTAGLNRLGYRLRYDGEHYELETVQRELIEKFSKRRAQIEAMADEQMSRRMPALTSTRCAIASRTIIVREKSAMRTPTRCGRTGCGK
ncbi:relaxase domain-containing protein (plasmid) [Termitidicoccus mucosus]